MLTKCCSKCNTEKLHGEFNKATRNKDGLTCHCKQCSADYMKSWHTNHPFKDTWHKMISRCYNPRHHNFKNYGARGITVCTSWRGSYEAYRDFRFSLGDSIDGLLSLDRIDNNGNYEPSNCRLATDSQQALNKRKRTGKPGVPQSKHVGVSWHKVHGKWTSNIMINGKCKHIGIFKTESEAVSARAAVTELAS